MFNLRLCEANTLFHYTYDKHLDWAQVTSWSTSHKPSQPSWCLVLFVSCYLNDDHYSHERQCIIQPHFINLICNATLSKILTAAFLAPSLPFFFLSFVLCFHPCLITEPFLFPVVHKEKLKTKLVLILLVWPSSCTAVVRFCEVVKNY